MGARLRRLVVAAVVVAAALWLGMLGPFGGDAQGPAGAQGPAAAPSGGVPPDAQPGRVAHVVDGDTVRFDVAGSGPLRRGQHRVRLIGIDSPELRTDTGPQCGAREATAFVADLLPAGSRVWLESDREDRDRFDRPLRYVWTSDGVLVNRAIVVAGHAQAVLLEPNDRWWPALRAAEDRSRADGAGLWGACSDV